MAGFYLTSQQTLAGALSLVPLGRRLVLVAPWVMRMVTAVEVLADRGHLVVAADGDATALLTAVARHRPDIAVVDVRMAQARR